MKIATCAALVAAAALAFPVRSAPPATPSRVVEIVARRFEFSPKEVTLKKGEAVLLRLRSEDVTHGFFSRPLKIDSEIVPGTPTEITVTPEVPGTFTVICDHFCGAGHGNMKMRIVVE